MKKSVSFLTCLLTFPLVFASCGGEKDARVKKATISTFSSYEEMQTFNYYNSFGKIGVNTDPKFITDGNTRARVEIHGNPKGNDPSMYIWCDTKYFSANDFSYVKALTMDVFNESGRETKLTLSFTSRKNKLRKTYPGTEYLLSPGKNNLVYYIDRQVAKYLCDIDALEYIRFDFAQTDSFDTFSLLYLDNLEAHYEYTETEALIKEIERTETTDEILYFEDKIDLFNVNALSYQCSSASYPKISINTNPLYVSQGSKSLKVDVAVNPNEGHPDPWPGIRIEKEYLSSFDFTAYGDDAEISFDILNAGYKTKTLAWNVRDKKDNSLEVAAAVLPAGEWVRVTAKLSDMRYKNGRQGEPLDLSALESFTINYAHEYGGQSYAFYVDNFYISK